MTLGRSRLFLKRRPDAERLAEVIGFGHIGDVLDELDNPCWTPPKDLPWDSYLPSPDVPVDATTSLGGTLLAEALLTPREYEFRLAVACLLLEKGAQPRTCTENGRGIEAILEQLPPPQYVGDPVWQIRDVVVTAVDCRLDRIPFLIRRHAPFVGEWIDAQLTWLQEAEKEAEKEAEDHANSDGGTSAGEGELVSNGNRDSVLRHDEDLLDYVDEDLDLTDKPAARNLSQAHVTLDNTAETTSLPAHAGVLGNSNLPIASPHPAPPLASPAGPIPPSHDRVQPLEAHPSSTGAPSRPLLMGSHGTSSTPGSLGRASRLPASVRSRPRLSVGNRLQAVSPFSGGTALRADERPPISAPRTEAGTPDTPGSVASAPAPNTSTPAQGPSIHAETFKFAVARGEPALFSLHGVPEGITPTILRHYLIHGPATFLTAQAEEVPLLQHLIDVGSLRPDTATGAALPPVPTDVKIEEFKTPEERCFHGPVVGHVTYASAEAAEKARSIFEGQRMFSEAVPGSQPIRWLRSEPKR